MTLSSTEPIFIHSLFRSGSTYMYHAIKRTGDFHVYHEPFHEFISSLPSAWGDTQKRTLDLKDHLRHEFLAGNYFEEYENVLPLLGEVFTPEISLGLFFLDAADESPMLKRYIDTLLQHSLRTPVLQCTRSTGRIAWMKKTYPSRSIFLLRNPWDQWFSYKVDAYISATPQIIFSQANLPRALQQLTRMAGFQPLPAGDVARMVEYCRVHPIAPRVDYSLFFGVWLYSLISGRADCDWVVDMDAASQDGESRLQTVQALQRLGIQRLSLTDCRVHRTQFKPGELGFYQEIEEQVIDIFRSNGFTMQQLAPVVEYLQRQRLTSFTIPLAPHSDSARALEDAARMRSMLLQSDEASAALVGSLHNTVGILSNEVTRLNGVLAQITSSRPWRVFRFLRSILNTLRSAGRGVLRFLRALVSLLVKAARGLPKAWMFMRRYGIKAFASELLTRLRPPAPEQHTLEGLVEKFPASFAESASGSMQQRLEQFAVRCLDDLSRCLDLSFDSGQVLSLYKKELGESEYYCLLEALFGVDEVTAARPGAPGLPIIQASSLPPLDSAQPHRRILFITAQFPTPYHGGGNRILNFIKILSRENDIYLAAGFIPDQDQEAFQAIAPYCRSIYKISAWDFGGKQAAIRSWLAGTPIDIVHYEWPRSLENYDPAHGRRQIFTYMEAVSLRLLMDMKRLEPLSTPWLSKLGELIPALRLELAGTAPLDARVAVTTKDAEFFRRLDPHQQYTVLNHGLTFDKFVLPEVPSEPRTIVFVGNYVHYPNMDAINWFFAEMWDSICRAVPDVRMYVVGTHPPRDLLARVDGQHIFVTGSVPDVRPYIQKATLCIAPLVSGAGLRGKVIEYAALRRPFVATSIAVEDLVFEDGRDFLLADEAQHFAQQVISLLEDEARAARMGLSAYETARQNYDTNMLADFLQRIYHRLDTEPPQ